MPIIVTTTSDSKLELEEISKRLVDERLAACCQILGPMTSIYLWRETIEEANEWICFIKTESECYPAIEKVIHEMHHYEEPEILVTSIEGGSEGYLRWLASSVTRT